MAWHFSIQFRTQRTGDSRQTAGSRGLRKYILAQYQGDADLDWVRRLRVLLNRDELKYRDFHPEHRRIKSSDPDLYSAVEMESARLPSL